MQNTHTQLWHVLFKKNKKCNEDFWEKLLKEKFTKEIKDAHDQLGKGKRRRMQIKYYKDPEGDSQEDSNR